MFTHIHLRLPFSFFTREHMSSLVVCSLDFISAENLCASFDSFFTLLVWIFVRKKGGKAICLQFVISIFFFRVDRSPFFRTQHGWARARKKVSSFWGDAGGDGWKMFVILSYPAVILSYRFFSPFFLKFKSLLGFHIWNFLHALNVMWISRSAQLEKPLRLTWGEKEGKKLNRNFSPQDRKVL